MQHSTTLDSSQMPARIANIIRDHFPNRDAPLEILEAGCGRKWLIDLGNQAYRLTGVDLDAAALAFRRDVNKDLDVAIVGDLHSVQLPTEGFDVIYSAFVLEHVSDAELILQNFDRWLKPGGLLLVQIPDPLSVHGFVTRFTPFWLHVLHKRYVMGHENAGRPGFPPYPTTYSRVLSNRGFQDFLATTSLRRKLALSFGKYKNVELPIVFLLHYGSLGKLSNRWRNNLFVVEKLRCSTETLPPLPVSQ